MDFLLIRHGKSTRAEQDIYSRRFDAHLDLRYVSMLEEVYKYSKNLKVRKLYSSKALRCRETLAYIFDSKLDDMKIVEEFIPYGSGIFENKSDSWVRQNYPEYYESSYKDKFLHPKYNEESMAHQTQRIMPRLERLFKVLKSEPIALCTHYSVIQVICNVLFLNFDINTFADSHFDLKEGEFLHLCMSNNRCSIYSTNSNKVFLPRTNLSELFAS